MTARLSTYPEALQEVLFVSVAGGARLEPQGVGRRVIHDVVPDLVVPSTAYTHMDHVLKDRRRDEYR